MKVLVIGATGFLGSHVAKRLRETGHDVSGLARTAEAGAKLQATGVTPVYGDLEKDLPGLVDAATAFDATIYAAQLLLAPERDAVGAFLDALEGSGKTFIFTSGTGVLGQRTGGDWSEDTFAEDDEFVPSKQIGARLDTENLVRAANGRGVRGIAMRPPMVWGPGGGPHLSMIYASVSRVGAACYIGRGLNMYSNVHVEDLAELYRLALEKGEAGALYHGVSGEIANRWLAEAVARDMGVETRSISIDEAVEIWGRPGALIVMSVSSRSRSPRAKRDLGWVPTRLDIFDQIGDPALRALAKPAA